MSTSGLILLYALDLTFNFANIFICFIMNYGKEFKQKGCFCFDIIDYFIIVVKNGQ